MEINRGSTLIEIAAIVSQALESKGVPATLSGGGAVTLYSNNEYLSYDLDFISSAGHDSISAAVEPLGFTREGNTRKYIHVDSDYYIEFPPGPLAFGETVVKSHDTCLLDTTYGPLRIITPTQSIMDRLSSYVHWKDRPSLRQAQMIAKSQTIDWDALCAWANKEGIEPEILNRIKDAKP